ncbi:Protein CBG20996 [Caenorhabditis briggsae]|uniref:Protein CBG20996 n=1 Tax=Caenorhabditis briggsae TaxID=6238 RepID=A8XZ49_CAEBR|nr:Protein CBG20996 [Caenorhabditis briggsae]CAP37916.2 Protein CBG20996 [Caenorhabditis briggsae]
MYKLLALLALVVSSASGIPTPSPPVSSETSSENKPSVAKSHPFQAGLPTGLFSSGSSFNLPTQTTICRIRTVGRSINNVCPIGFTVITNVRKCSVGDREAVFSNVRDFENRKNPFFGNF